MSCCLMTKFHTLFPTKLRKYPYNHIDKNFVKKVTKKESHKKLFFSLGEKEPNYKKMKYLKTINIVINN